MKFKKVKKKGPDPHRGEKYAGIPKAPDGGYGWIIVIASFFSHVFVYGICWTVGVYHVIFLKHFKEGSGRIAIISSLNTAMVYGSGPIASILTNKFGFRPTAILGGFLAALGLVLSMLAVDIVHLCLTFGVLTGSGLGLAFIPAVSIVGMYFEKYRTIAIGIAVSGAGFGTFIFPPIIRYFAEVFDWRSSLLLTGGLVFNLCFFGALFRPLENKVIDSNSNEVKALPKKKKIIQLGIFRNLNYLALCVNNTLWCFGSSVVQVHLSSYAIVEGGIGTDKAAMLFSIMGMSNLIGRVAYGLLAHHKQLKPLVLYTVSYFVVGLLTVVFPLWKGYPLFVTYAALFGLLSACFGAMLPPILCDMLSVGQLTSAYGYLLVFEAIGVLVGAPAAGWLFDASRFFPASFYLGGASIILSALVLVPPIRSMYSLKTVADKETKRRDENVLLESMVSTV